MSITSSDPPVVPPSRWSRVWRPLLAGIAGITVFLSVGYWMLSYADQREKIDVVVATRDLAAPYLLGAGDLRVVRRARMDLPRTAIARVDAVLGATLVKSMSEQEILTTNHFLKSIAPSAESLLVTDGVHGFSLPTSWLAGPPPKLVQNDRITVIASAADKPVNTGTTLIGERLRVLKVDADSAGLPERILLDARMLDAAQLLQAHANRLALVVLVEPVVLPATATSTPQ